MMNTMTPKTPHPQSTQISIKAKLADNGHASDTRGNQEIIDSPRAFASPKKPARKLVAKQVEKEADAVATKLPGRSIRTTLRAQIRAGKNDSAEMYADAFKAPASPSRVASPKAHSATFRVRLSALSLKEAVALSDEAFDNLEFSSSDDESLNTGWNEWGIGSDDEGSVGKSGPKETHRVNAKQVDGAGASSDDESIDLHWNEWGMSSDDEA